MPNHPPLTRQEKEVLLWLSHGKTAWEIGTILNLDKRAVEWRIHRILRKLGVNNGTAAVAKALREGELDGGTSKKNS